MARISRFPDDYRLIHRHTGAALFGSASLQDIRKEVWRKNYTVIRLPDFGGIEYWLALRGFLVYQPYQKRSSGSQALYLAHSANKKEGLLLQLMLQHSKTSCHKHTKKREAFHLIAGEATLLTSQGIWKLYRGETHIVEPGTLHQTRTGLRPALIVVEVTGDPEELSMDDYEYCDEFLLTPNP